MYYSGLDRSGHPGNPRADGMSDYLVIGLAQVHGNDLPHLAQVLADIRHGSGLAPRFTFKYSHFSDKVKAAFFSQIPVVTLTTRLAQIDKRDWYEPRRSGRPNEWLDEAIAQLVCCSPRETIVDQVLLIDRSKKEMAAVRRTAAVIKQALKGAGMQPYPQIKPCPDTRSQGEIVQVVDMFAGAYRAQGPRGCYLRRLQNMFVVV